MPSVEITWYGDTCLRLKGREGVVAADAYRSVVGPTGRGLTADIVTYSHPDDAPTQTRTKSTGLNGHASGLLRPTSLDPAFILDGPGEYEVHEILINGVRTFRDDDRGRQRGHNTCFVYELDGLHIVHLGDIGHVLEEDGLGEIGSVDVVCVPIGSALTAAKAAEVATQVDARLIVPMLIGEGEVARGALDRFMHEMSVQHPTPVPKLSATISTIPAETTVVVLESRTKV
jgi:L-ascorbate metabolism protein UlaG (beta-lactamase superfamily)